MTPTEKARDLITKFNKHSRVQSSGFLVSNEDTTIKSAINCALIAAEEIINILCDLHSNSWVSDSIEIIVEKEIIYWQEVKQHLNEMK